ncbi:hypothetical protein FO519_001363 [Halicephalobus sp. NKZ332]|nr:hypothetical protein FO519_001363 [Halicephalobus sp. NKZ332]
MSKRLVFLVTLFAFAYALPQEEAPQPTEEEPTEAPQPETPQPETPSAKRRQFIAPPVFAAPAPILAQPPVVVSPVGQCPGGPSLPLECDPKRPTCPPQSYCYATNTVDIGPYFCCPIWSTYGAAWRPAAPFFNYVPPPPPNWPEAIRATAAWPTSAYSMPVLAAPLRPLKSKKEQKFDGLTEEEQHKIEKSMADWLNRQAKKN